ncbi:hypothetical protein [Cryptosporangium aurantiacum]|uniref:Asl1-like glycosyl hydrolase catalytic domain-containing protein n=1 Tax=Cryptosporangium aurantiacum TaxID=134849 RepID=A0A1M7RBY8_9ACTN|nr:hypothetical protein [Cryptosporangium aurantiacum]SHN43649.1 hypothetical protein SAMN05443668_109288 [Cryptosporangium aurantiacum]
MRARGINYDTGFLPGAASRPEFSPDAVRHDLGVIARNLHCDAVRISGGDPERLRVAADAAASEGLEVWFAPFPVDLSTDEVLRLFGECAELAADLPGDVVFVAGCEMSAFCHGFLPGATYGERLATLAAADLEWWSSLGPVIERLNGFLVEVAATVRRRFDGRVTYAAAPWEFIDWTPFDVVSVDAYRAAYNAATFRDEVRGHFAHGKPVAVTEFGTCAYRGAADHGGMAWQPPPGAVRDEDEQVRYFTELMDVFEAEGVDTALWFTFAGFAHVGEADLASYGVVRMLDGSRWEPKAVFAAMADRYARPAS